MDESGGAPGDAGGPMAAGIARTLNPVKRWVADTGCGNDLIPRAMVESADPPVTSVSDASVQFQTANGTAEAAEVADVQVSELDEIVSPYILEETPSVLSVGARCMHLGYSFIWLAGECPYFIRPDGYWVHLRVLGNVP